MTQTSNIFFEALRRSLGDHAIDSSEETSKRYGRNLLPGGDRRPAGVVSPSSTVEVQTMVRLASEHRISLYAFTPARTGDRAFEVPF